MAAVNEQTVNSSFLSATVLLYGAGETPVCCLQGNQFEAACLPAQHPLLQRFSQYLMTLVLLAACGMPEGPCCPDKTCSDPGTVCDSIFIYEINKPPVEEFRCVQCGGPLEKALARQKVPACTGTAAYCQI
jgi:hypothetical protein